MYDMVRYRRGTSIPNVCAPVRMSQVLNFELGMTHENSRPSKYIIDYFKTVCRLWVKGFRELKKSLHIWPLMLFLTDDILFRVRPFTK